jgi:1-acyl-sn-glycerol-3-phosphate acyltransferase
MGLGMKTRWWYRVLKLYVQAGLRLFFHKWQTTGLEHVPEGKPVIMVCNHQNAFLDALLVLGSLKKSPWFFARSDVFKNPAAASLLHSLKMLPIYRFRDGGIRVLKGNQDSFSEAIALLLQRERILIFGEGNHGEQWQLRPLQRGFAKLALRAMQEHPEMDLRILPVGLQYENRNEVYSEVLVSFGESLSAADYLQLPEAQGIRKMVKELSKSMQKLIVHIPEEDYDTCHPALLKARRPSSDLQERLLEDQDLLKRLKSGEAPPPSKLQAKRRNGLVNSMAGAYAYFNHAPFRWIYSFFVKKTDDSQFKLSIEFIAFIFLYPILLLLQFALVHIITGNEALGMAYLISVPLSALVYLRPLR